MKENKSIIKFHEEICPDIPIDSYQFFCRFAAAINENSDTNNDKNCTRGDIND